MNITIKLNHDESTRLAIIKPVNLSFEEYVRELVIDHIEDRKEVEGAEKALDRYHAGEEEATDLTILMERARNESHRS